MRIREVRLSRFPRNGTDRLYVHSIVEFFREVRLVEPHDLDRARCVANDGFADGNFSLPRPPRLKIAYRSEDRHFRTGDEPCDSRFAPALVVPRREVTHQFLNT